MTDKSDIARAERILRDAGVAAPATPATDSADELLRIWATLSEVDKALLVWSARALANNDLHELVHTGLRTMINCLGREALIINQAAKIRASQRGASPG